MSHLRARPPEMVIEPEITRKAEKESDIWSLSACILELLLNQKTWNLDNFESLEQAMSVQMEPHVLAHLIGATPQLRFLLDSFYYTPQSRPSIAILLKALEETFDKGKYY